MCQTGNSKSYHPTVCGKSSSLLFKHKIIDMSWFSISRKHISRGSHLLCPKGIFWSKLQCYKKKTNLNSEYIKLELLELLYNIFSTLYHEGLSNRSGTRSPHVLSAAGQWLMSSVCQPVGQKERNPAHLSLCVAIQI